MVLTNSRRVSRVPRYLGVRSRKADPFHLQDCHLLWFALPDDSAIHQLGNFPSRPEPAPIEPHDPEYTTLPGFNIYSVWAVPRSLAATEGITVVFSSSGY